LKAIPGADLKLIYEAGRYADRMSVNIELPTNESLGLLAPQKNKDSILKPMAYLKNQISLCLDDKKHFRNTPLFVPAGQSTQMIIGATPDNDHTILGLTENLYKKMSLKRVYYSAYIPVSGSSSLPALPQPPLAREHRLYQADWLLRFYGFTVNELFNKNQGYLSLHMDPKCSWALDNLNLFPVEINRAGYDTLLRVPGIGMLSARRICLARRTSTITFENLKKMGIVLKRARYFITCKGRYYNEPDSFYNKIDLWDRSIIEHHLSDNISNKYTKTGYENQISIFSYMPGIEKTYPIEAGMKL
jgi:putative DNA modification/repair radical SAM protein